MNICLISKSDVKGGAAKVAFQLGKGLIAEGHQVTLLVQNKSSDAEWVEELDSPPPGNRRISQRIIHRLGINTLALNRPFPKSLGRAYFSRFDVIHLHDLPDTFNLGALPWLSRIRPVFWTLHTLHAFTGGCFYPYACRRHLQHCGNCPQFGKFPLQWLHRDGSRLVLALKKWIYKRSALNVICVSNWLADQTRQGILGRFPVHTVQNPVDTKLFFPMNKAEAKQRLGIPPEKKTILFAVAANLEDSRKGFDIICEALKALELPDVFLIPTAISGDSPQLEEALRGKDSLAPRHLSTDEELRLHYSAADVIWHPTRADTSSMVGLEAIACGTPVIAARVGGVPEIVKDGTTGLLIDVNSSDALVKCTIKYFEDHVADLQTALEKGDLLVERHGMKQFKARHLALYRDIILT